MLQFKIVFYFALVCAMALSISSDHCQNLDRLKTQAMSSQNPAFEWYAAARQGDDESVYFLGQHAVEQNDPHWLDISANLGAAEALHALALEELNSSEHKALLTRAANLGHAESQFELSLILSYGPSKLRWLEKAAEQSHQQAIIALYQWHLMREDFTQAETWLQEAREFDAESAFILARHKWRNGQYNEAISGFNQADKLGHIKANKYLHHIKLFWRQPVEKTKSLSRFQSIKSQCVMRLQMVAESLDGLIKSTEFQKQYSKDRRLADLPICINSPVLLEPGNLQCQSNWQGTKRLGCNVTRIENALSALDFSHVVVFDQEGKANVQNGIMFLDLADSYEVFVHELAHFAGFMDEYPLSSGLAEQACINSTAPNLVLAKPNSNLEFEDLRNWMTLNNHLKLTPARTCNNHQSQAFKPVGMMTFMEFYDQGVIPPVYLSLWKQVLEDRKRLVPAFVNFAQAFDAQGKPESAEKWWRRYRVFIAPEQKTSLEGL